MELGPRPRPQTKSLWKVSISGTAPPVTLKRGGLVPAIGRAAQAQQPQQDVMILMSSGQELEFRLAPELSQSLKPGQLPDEVGAVSSTGPRAKRRAPAQRSQKPPQQVTVGVVQLGDVYELPPAAASVSTSVQSFSKTLSSMSPGQAVEEFSLGRMYPGALGAPRAGRMQLVSQLQPIAEPDEEPKQQAKFPGLPESRHPRRQPKFMQQLQQQQQQQQQQLKQSCQLSQPKQQQFSFGQLPEAKQVSRLPQHLQQLQQQQETLQGQSELNLRRGAFPVLPPTKQKKLTGPKLGESQHQKSVQQRTELRNSLLEPLLQQQPQSEQQPLQQQLLQQLLNQQQQLPQSEQQPLQQQLLQQLLNQQQQLPQSEQQPLQQQLLQQLLNQQQQLPQSEQQPLQQQLLQQLLNQQQQLPQSEQQPLQQQLLQQLLNQQQPQSEQQQQLLQQLLNQQQPQSEQQQQLLQQLLNQQQPQSEQQQQLLQQLLNQQQPQSEQQQQLLQQLLNQQQPQSEQQQQLLQQLLNQQQPQSEQQQQLLQQLLNQQQPQSEQQQQLLQQLLNQQQPQSEQQQQDVPAQLQQQQQDRQLAEHEQSEQLSFQNQSQLDEQEQQLQSQSEQEQHAGEATDSTIDDADKTPTSKTPVETDSDKESDKDSEESEAAMPFDDGEDLGDEEEELEAVDEIDVEEDEEDDDLPELELLTGPLSLGRHPTVDAVFRGSLDDLPAMPSKIVRIFTSSTFTDTGVERNSLMERVYPKIKEYCREKHGLEFQVVDMRWGVRDEATDDHMTTELCLREIKTCQRVSVGPNFVVLLGQKYGYRPVPTLIDAQEFDMIVAAVRQGGAEKDAACLERWYKRDANIVPPVQVLQPISSILIHFNNKGMQKMMEAHQNEWWSTMSSMQVIFRQAADALFAQGKLDADQRHNYFMSVTERENIHGILTAESNHRHTLAFLRQLEGISLENWRTARNFIDMSGPEVDREAQRLMDDLRDRKIPECLRASSIIRYSQPWVDPSGIHLDTHKEYIDQFCDTFYTRLVKLIDRGARRNRLVSKDATLAEILQHLLVCAKLCELFQGREADLQKIRNYCRDPDNRQIFIIYGDPGCGKTSLMAKSCGQVRDWFQDEQSQLQQVEPCIVFRLLGTSPQSSSLLVLLTSLCRQLSFLYEQRTVDIPEELPRLIQHFKQLMTFATPQRPLLVFLDSLEELSPENNAHLLLWLPDELPPNVKVVLSSLPNFHGLLKTFNLKVSRTENFLKLDDLGKPLSLEVLKVWLRSANRSITEQQWQVVDKAISKCASPLFVKIVFDEITRWRSYDSPEKTVLSFNIFDGIMQLFQRIENQHGLILVTHAFSYITASKSGISESELEDSLSLDEKVLNDVYQYHLPPSRRIPPLLWTRIRNELPGFLVEKEADGASVVYWYHRQFFQVCEKRYFKNLNFKSSIHSNLADYYLGKWAGVPKPFAYSELQKQRFGLKDVNSESDRMVPPQPLRLNDGTSRTAARYNLRKLSELPFQLLKSGRMAELASECLFNYQFLHAKLSAFPLQALLSDLDSMIAKTNDKDARILSECLRLSASIITKSPNMLGPQVSGRLLPYYANYEKVRNLIHECDREGPTHCALVPGHHYLYTPGGPLEYSLEGHQFACYGMQVTSDSNYLVSVSNQFIIWDLQTGEIFRNIPVLGLQGITRGMSVDSEDRRAVSYTSNNQLVFTDLVSGEYKFYDMPREAEIRGVLITSATCLAYTARGWSEFSHAAELTSSNQLPEKEDGCVEEILHFGFSGDSGGGDSDREFYFCTSVATVDARGSGGVDAGESSTSREFKLYFCRDITRSLRYHTGLAMGQHQYFLAERSKEDASLDFAIHRYVRNHQGGSDGDAGFGVKEAAYVDNVEEFCGLTLSDDESILVAACSNEFKLWHLTSQNRPCVLALLPKGCQNIPNRNPMQNLVAFSRGNEFMVAALRHLVLVYSCKTGTLMKKLDAHFGRVIALTSSAPLNRLISSAMDKTIKVWNFNNIMERVFSIPHMEKPIDSISLAKDGRTALTVARTHLGLWDFQRGHLLRTFSASGSAIIFKAIISHDATAAVSGDNRRLVFWRLPEGEATQTRDCGPVVGLELSQDGAKLVAVSTDKRAPKTTSLVCYSMPGGELLFEFEYYQGAEFVAPIVALDSARLLVPCAANDDEFIVSFYDAASGAFLDKTKPRLGGNDAKPVRQLVALPGKPAWLGLITEDRGHIWDVRKKAAVRSVPEWQGDVTSDGAYGLFSPLIGGVKLLDLRKPQHSKWILRRQAADGVFPSLTVFTNNDKYIVHFHSGRKTVRLIRVADGALLADFKVHAEVKALVGCVDNRGVVCGGVDGSLTLLVIADPSEPDFVEQLASLPSRSVELVLRDRAGGGSGGGDEAANLPMAAGVRVARLVSQWRMSRVDNSKACCVQ
ncbi:hypothetical protein BOX15_Mlig005707g1 [Macrostomum lignano]|uniref:NACHT domain-containing protein n=1 Tax=Macrostomum lignano TaxID=282301 RepID=A0A267GGQ3_9PLAT|nr:hypothetical protein BOX15_Mlig005707g1 [Macrostomum lignano]